MRSSLTSTLWAKPRPSVQFSFLHLQTHNLDMCKASNSKTRTQEVVETTTVLIKTWLTSTSCQLPNERKWCNMATTCPIWCNLTRSADKDLLFQLVVVVAELNVALTAVCVSETKSHSYKPLVAFFLLHHKKFTVRTLYFCVLMCQTGETKRPPARIKNQSSFQSITIWWVSV